ncbi:MAG TPA: hypothetical protein VLJ37_07495 [bacterium]|nr:hypothetical protein [bacterium]
MTQTLQQALLKAGLISQDKLKKAEAEKKAAERAARFPKKEERRPPPPPKLAAPKPAKPAPPPPRPAAPPPKKSLGFIEGKHHHHIRTQCEACGRPSPDVEYYEHKNRALDKYWLCVRCADDNNILDDFRQTMQSSQSQKGIFQRGYGPTKVFRRKL